MSPMIEPEPQLAGDYWVLPSVDGTADGVLRLHVAIAVADPEDLGGGDVSVELIADGAPMQMLVAPEDGPLPSLATIGVNAYAIYRFANPDGQEPSTATVSVRGESATFDVSVPIG